MSNAMDWLEQFYELLPCLATGIGLLAFVGIWIECKSSTTEQIDNGFYKPRR